MTEKFYIKSEYGENKDLEVYESRRLIGPNSCDDNWELQRYTSELRNSDDSFYAYIDFEGDEGTIRECPHCEEYGFHYKLGPKIKKKNEPPAPDDDQFLSCYECGTTFGIHETFQEAKIKDTLQTTDNPYEGNESIFLSVDSRATERKKREIRDRYSKGVKKHTSKRFRDKEQQDPEIQAEIDKGNIVNILYDPSY